jgi:hypothetical protein
MHSKTRLHLPDAHDADDAVARFIPTGPADIELEWFFTMAESDMGSRSNFGASVGDPPQDSPESCAEAARAARIIEGRLQRIGELHAGVLTAAYRARPWPLRLREALRRVTGVVVRIGSAEQGLPDDLGERDALDLRTATWLADALARGDRQGFSGLELRARVLLRAAVVAYQQVRGGGERPVLPGVSR